MSGHVVTLCLHCGALLSIHSRMQYIITYTVALVYIVKSQSSLKTLGLERGSNPHTHITLLLTTYPSLVISTAIVSEARASSEWNARQSGVAREETTNGLH